MSNGTHQLPCSCRSNSSMMGKVNEGISTMTGTMTSNAFILNDGFHISKKTHCCGITWSKTIIINKILCSLVYSQSYKIYLRLCKRIFPRGLHLLVGIIISDDFLNSESPKSNGVTSPVIITFT